MKNIVYTFCLLFVATLGYSQIKVVATGDVGIGTTSPAAQLHVDGGDAVFMNGKFGLGTLTPTDLYQLEKDGGSPAFSVRRTSGGGATIDNFVRLLAGSAGSGFFFEEDNYFAITPGVDATDNGTDWSNCLVLYGSNAGAKSGFVGIGTQNPGEKLHVIGNIKYSGSLINSDKNLKKNVNNFKAGLNEVLQLNPIKYEYNGKGGTIDGEEHIGLYAQELESVVPDLVKPYVHQTIAEDDDNLNKSPNVIKEETFLSIKDNEIKYILINAIKDQQAIIEQKEERIAALENQMAELISAVNDIKDGISEGHVISEVTLENYDLASLEQNTPNPFNGYTEISYVIPNETRTAQIQIFDFNGKMIKSVNLDHLGEGTLRVNANEIPSGTYNYSLLIDGRVVETKKMALVK